MLGVQLGLGAQRWSVRALVDTGAPFTLFDRAAGNALGVDYARPDARRERHRICGGTYIAQVEQINLVVKPFTDLVWTAEVGFFLDDWGMPFPGLLGQFGFLDHWVVSFDFPHGFVVEERSAFESRLPPLSEDDIYAIWENQELGWKDPPPTSL